MKIILFTSTRCPKCPKFRRLLRDVCKELGLIEGKDFVEKLIDGSSIELGKAVIDGDEFFIVDSEENIRETPAIVGGVDFFLSALQYQVASTPALVINGELAFTEVPTREELLRKLKSQCIK